MNQPIAFRRAGFVAALALLCLIPVSSAYAASATVTGDNLQPTPLNGATIRHMSPEVKFTFDASEKRYSVQILGPAGTPVSTGTTCSSTEFPSTENVGYQGNGAYRVVLKVTSSPEDSDCAQATETTLTFTINAFVTITPPGGALLSRDPGETSLNEWEVPLSLNPGAATYELRFALNATIGPDGGIVGESKQGFINGSTGSAAVTFPRPGRYTLVARAGIFTSGGQRFTPWSQRVDVTILAPFDMNPTTFPDARGPSYKVAGQVREPTAKGKITISLARGKRGGKFKRIGVVKIGRNGRFSLRFTARKFGYYRLRYSFKGSPGVQGGTLVETIRITRVFG